MSMTNPEVKSDKIDVNGKFLPFYGFTIVSMVTDRIQMEGLLSYIKSTKTLSHYLSPLPISSYHVTILDLFTQRSVPEKYRPRSGLAPSKHWDAALSTDMLDLQKVCDSLRGRITFKPSNLKFTPVPGGALVVVGAITNDEEVARLRSDLTLLLKRQDGNRVFHLTLGYLYRSVDQGDLPAIDQELGGLWKLLAPEYKLEQPSVCYFETMEEFVPFKSMSF